MDPKWTQATSRRNGNAPNLHMRGHEFECYAGRFKPNFFVFFSFLFLSCEHNCLNLLYTLAMKQIWKFNLNPWLLAWPRLKKNGYVSPVLVCTTLLQNTCYIIFFSKQLKLFLSDFIFDLNMDFLMPVLLDIHTNHKFFQSQIFYHYSLTVLEA